MWRVRADIVRDNEHQLTQRFEEDELLALVLYSLEYLEALLTMLRQHSPRAFRILLHRHQAQRQVVEQEVVYLVPLQIGNHTFKNVAPVDPIVGLEAELEAHFEQVVAVAANFAHGCHLQIEALGGFEDVVQSFGCIDVGVI